MSEDGRRVGDEEMAELIARMHAGGADIVPAIDALLLRYNDDARLHFLRGSVLAGDGRPLEAHRSLSKAVDLDPSFDIARFQLGFFELTSGEAEAALKTWGPLDRLPADHYLRLFIDGLRALIADGFGECIRLLDAGIARNSDNPPLNKDMALIIAACRGLGGVGEVERSAPDDAVTETALLLTRFGASGKTN